MDPLIWTALISLAVLLSVAFVILVVKLCCPHLFCPCGGECHYSFITSDDLLYTVEPKRRDDVEGGASNRVEPKEQSRPANSNKNLSSASVIHGARILTNTAGSTQEPRKIPTTAASSSVVFQHRKPHTASTSVASEPKKTPTTGASTSLVVSGPPDQTVSSAPVCFGEPQPAKIPSELHSRLFDEEIRLSRLLDQETLISWAVEASNPPAILPILHTPTAPLDDGARGGLPDHGEPQACVLDHRSGKEETAAINLTFEEQIEVAIRRSAESSSTPLFSIISPSSSSCSSYIPNPSPASEPKPGDLRLIVIDGPNVAWARGFRLNCSAKRLEIAYKFFREKGHNVAIFLPRKMFTCARLEDQVILTALEEKEALFIVQDLAYDDLMIIEYANQKKGIIISNDKYREILETHPEWEDQILNRTLQFTWAIDTFIIATDPFGRNGPSLDQILHH